VCGLRLAIYDRAVYIRRFVQPVIKMYDARRLSHWNAVANSSRDRRVGLALTTTDWRRDDGHAIQDRYAVQPISLGADGAVVPSSSSSFVRLRSIPLRRSPVSVSSRRHLCLPRPPRSYRWPRCPGDRQTPAKFPGAVTSNLRWDCV